MLLLYSQLYANWIILSEDQSVLIHNMFYSMKFVTSLPGDHAWMRAMAAPTFTYHLMHHQITLPTQKITQMAHMLGKNDSK